MQFDIEFDEVSKIFGSYLAVDNVSFSIPKGSFFSLLGPSGCGKTTILRMTSGFEWPDTGQIRIAGADMHNVAPYRRPTNMVFQRWALFPHMTVAQNVAFGLEVERLSRREIQQRVGEALELVDLAALAERKPRQLSGGQMQRVALARALAKRPKVLLLDEPLGSLDLKLRMQMQLELKGIQREVGTTFMYVTHDQSEALTMSDQIAVMSQGKIHQLDTPQAIYDQPATRFVASFIGNTNLVPVDVIAVSGDKARVKLDGMEFWSPRARSFDSGSKGTVSIRFERILIGPGAASCEGSSRGVVTEAIFSGSLIRYAILLNGSLTRLIVEKPYDGTSVPFAGGNEVDIGWDGGATRLFSDD